MCACACARLAPLWTCARHQITNDALSEARRILYQLNALGTTPPETPSICRYVVHFRAEESLKNHAWVV